MKFENDSPSDTHRLLLSLSDKKRKSSNKYLAL